MLHLLSVSAIAIPLLAAGNWARPTPPPQHVVGGTNCTECEFPASVFIGSGGGFNCTASLVHPRVIITAAHCLGGISQAGFGESAFGPAMTVSVERCEGHQYLDLAFCVLAEDAPDVGMVPVIMGCEADELVAGKEITLAGFGQSDEASGSGGGTKRWTTNTVDYLSYDNGELYLNGTGTGSCYGDSGGPAYVQLADGSWRVIAAVQGPHPQAPPLGCGHGGTYTLIHPSMDWIESSSGHDITPCFDADGTWNPDERCTEFPMQLQGFGGAWGGLCGGAMLSGAGESCGAGIGPTDPEPETTGGAESGESSGGPSSDSDPGVGGSSSGGGTVDDDDAPDDDDDDDDQDASAGAPGYLPPRYGHDNVAQACTAGGSAPPPLSLLVLALLGLCRRRDAAIGSPRAR